MRIFFHNTTSTAILLTLFKYFVFLFEIFGENGNNNNKIIRLSPKVKTTPDDKLLHHSCLRRQVPYFLIYLVNVYFKINAESGNRKRTG